VGRLQPYTGTNAYRCPDDKNRQRHYSYAINDFLTVHPFGAETLDFSKHTSLPSPSDTFYVAECDDLYEGADHFHFADASARFRPRFFHASRGQTPRVGANYLFKTATPPFAWRGSSSNSRKGDRLVRPDGNP
jgi:hypothetical protein